MRAFLILFLKVALAVVAATAFLICASVLVLMSEIPPGIGIPMVMFAVTIALTLMLWILGRR